MIAAIVFLAVAVSSAVCTDGFVPDCPNVEYYQGLSYVADDEKCSVYYVCYRNPYSNGMDGYEFKWALLCCPEGMSWDALHLTCTWNHDCNDTREECPSVTTTDGPCPEQAFPGDDTKFINSATWQVRMCPYGQVWSQEDCTCTHDSWATNTCNQVLHYDFNDTYNSHACYNWIHGDPYGNPSLEGEVLSLNGVNQFLSIAFLNNYFTWNPAADKFTIAFFIKPEVAAQDSGLFSAQIQGGNPLDIMLVSGEVVLRVANSEVSTTAFPSTSEFSLVFVYCIPSHYGIIVVNGGGATLPAPIWFPRPLRQVGATQRAATLGYVQGMAPFRGSVDDFAFWNIELQQADAEAIFNARPSNDL